MGELLLPGRDFKATDDIAQRMLAVDRMAMPGEEGGGNPDLPRDPWQPRWRIDTKYIEFECGCRAIRFATSAVPLENFDPVIFRDLPEQAVYDFVCHRHGPGMNVYTHFGHFATFDQWKRRRQHLILGRTV